MIEVNTPAPDFSLEDQNGDRHALSDYRGRRVVLYFYPKDSTAGCTKQAQGYSELKEAFAEKNAVVIGISRDSVKSHKGFETRYDLRLTLLSDPELTAIGAYGVWQEKKMCGKVSMGVVRSAFLIDENGVVTAVKYNVKAADNPAQMLALL